MKDVSVIIPAAGAGRRFGATHNKIFLPLAGEPIFLRSLRLFAGRQDVCQVQLVVSAEDHDRLLNQYSQELEQLGVEVIVGGATRSRSVRNALARLSREARWVCVHDAVRPCVAPHWVDAVLAQARRTGAAILAYPVHGTLKLVDEKHLITRTLPRQAAWEAQTPQVFLRELILRAYEGDREATDDAHLVEQLGQPVSVVLGDPRNIKITTPRDLELAEAVLPSLASHT
jgi:2-C-methyl-D-erythritol 4-phosphate cytidylyltransferase